MTEKKLVKEQMMLTFAYDPAFMPKPKGWPLVYRVNPDRWNGVEVVYGHDKADPTITVRDLMRELRASDSPLFEKENSSEAGTFILEKDGTNQLQTRGYYSADSGMDSSYVLSLCEVTLEESDKRVIHHIKVLGSLSAVFGTYQRSPDKTVMEEVYPNEPIPDGEWDVVTLGFDFTEKFSLSPSLTIEANNEQLDIVLVGNDGVIYRSGT